MKKFSIILVAIIGFGISAKAQDIITLKNGDDINASVKEVGETEIKYKKFENLNGPIYTMKKSEIFMIKYQNGSKDVFNEVTIPEMQQQATDDLVDVVTLKNGSIFTGKIIAKDVSVIVFESKDGTRYQFPISDIDTSAGDEVVSQMSPSTAMQLQLIKQQQQQTTVNQQVSYSNTNVKSQQRLPVLKYTFGNKISPDGPGKSPFLAGFLSFLVPGVGQFYNGDVGAGFLYMGCNIVCNSIWMSAIKSNYYGIVTVDETQLTIGLVGALAINIISIVNAAHGANKVNIARGYRLANNTYLKIQPAIIQQNDLPIFREYAYGMDFCLNF
ncbi:MAG: hypothetical protein FWD66_06840 [Paludibacter sp.]|nr:hypothetical protein [Paludibacter sp.]